MLCGRRIELFLILLPSFHPFSLFQFTQYICGGREIDVSWEQRIGIHFAFMILCIFRNSLKVVKVILSNRVWSSETLQSQMNLTCFIQRLDSYTSKVKIWKVATPVLRRTQVSFTFLIPLQLIPTFHWAVFHSLIFSCPHESQTVGWERC